MVMSLYVFDHPDVSIVFGHPDVPFVFGHPDVPFVFGHPDVSFVFGHPDVPFVFGHPDVPFVFGHPDVLFVFGPHNVSFIFGHGDVLFVFNHHLHLAWRVVGHDEVTYILPSQSKFFLCPGTTSYQAVSLQPAHPREDILGSLHGYSGSVTLTGLRRSHCPPASVCSWYSRSPGS